MHVSINQHTLESHWKQIKTKLCERWGQISDEEFERAHASIDQLIGTITLKTGELRQTVERYLERIMKVSALDDDEQEIDRQVERDSEEPDAENIVQDAEDWAAKGERIAKEVFHQRPLSLALVAIGSGFVTGVAIVYLISQSRREKEETNIFRQVRRQIGDVVASTLSNVRSNFGH
jgi:uncharacterized protein YjbJ (UPF0337 family)